MTLVILHRQAPVAPGATCCQLCDRSIEGSRQDHLQVGQPGTAAVDGIICTRCGETLSRMVGLYGSDLNVVVQNDRPAVSSLIGGPAARSALALTSVDSAEPPAASSEDQLEQTRPRATDGAESTGAERS
jgi:hypothetical protein